MAYARRSICMTPYLYTLIAYFVLMFLAKLVLTFLGPKRKEKTSIRPQWSIDLHQIRESVMSFLF